MTQRSHSQGFRFGINMLGLILSLSLIGCQTPTARGVEQPLPTLFPTTTPDAFPLHNAERAATEFLIAWQQFDYATMHRLTSFASQEATPLAAFQQRYEAVHDEMTLDSLTFTPRTIQREPDNTRISHFTYDMTFDTRLVGAFTDTERDLTLIFDPQAQAWRVAWSAGSIFPELANGGQLRLETRGVNRANIYDRGGTVLASQEERLIVTVSIVRDKVPDTAACITALTEATRLPVEVITARYDSFASNWTNEIGSMEAQAYLDWREALERDCNATFGNRPGRRYHNGSLMPHILGSVGYLEAEALAAAQADGFNADSILGRSGVEASWDETLRGRPGAQLVIEGANGQRRRVVASREPKVAESLWLTLDANLQQYVLNLFGQSYAANAEGWGQSSDGAAAVVMDVNTGALLALVSWPTYDANAFAPFPAVGRKAANELAEAAQTDPRRPLLNRATQGLYPTGSVMKIATAIAVADSGVYALDKSYLCTGNGSFNRDIPRLDWLPQGHGLLTLPQAVTQSCNPYFYEAGYQMDIVDPDLFPNYVRRLGLGVSTGLTEIAEQPGNIGDSEWKRVNRGETWTFSDAVDMSIGQGMVEVTPLQVTRMVSAVANGGTLYRPYLVERVGLLNEFSHITEPDPIADINIRKEVLDVVRSGMCDVTSTPSGTAHYVFFDSPLQELGVCGKTGTAEDPPKLSHAWFAAYAPRTDPEIAVVVIVENSGEGSGVAAPLVRNIMEYYFLGVDNTIVAGQTEGEARAND